LTDFAARFGREPSATASAPARVNVIGEHTDYNGGLVLPIAIARRTQVALSLREDAEVRAFSTTLAADRAAARYRRGEEAPTGTWIDYVQGVTWALDELGGSAVPGFDLLVSSDVPVGAGLASSAALAVAVLRALRAACGLAIDDVTLARVAHRAETGLVGAPVGIMDQMAASLADEQRALFIDTRTLDTARVPMPPAAALAVIDSGITHDHASGDYRVRRAECEQAAAGMGVTLLSELSADDLPRLAALRPPLDRRARHVITENARVLAAMAAMRAGALDTLGRLLVASHASLRDDFEVSRPDIDTLVRLALEQPGVYGARLTGGGFGGAVIVLCRTETAEAVAHRIRSAYHAQTGRPARVLAPSDSEVAR
jgi:galactokinase